MGRLCVVQYQFKGVSWDKATTSWCAYINVNKKFTWLGYHPSEEEAARAYDRAAIEKFGEFACRNFPDGGLRDGTVEDLGNGYANGINVNQIVAGYVVQPDATSHATVWANGTVSDLLTLAGYDSSIATGISDSGGVVGVAFSSQNLATQAGFKWTQATGMQAIQGSATVSGINANGDIAGTSLALHATIFTATGTTIDLGTLGDFSIAIAVNNQGHAVGYSPLVPNAPVHPFFYNGTTIQDLGTLRSGAASYATSINDQDLVVGNDALNGDSRPWIWSATSGIVDLTTFISNPAWTLATVRGISATGGNCRGCGYQRDSSWLYVGAGELNTSVVSASISEEPE